MYALYPWKLDTLHHYIPCTKILRFTLGSSDGVGQTYPDGQSWQEPFPAIEYFPFPHNVGGPFLEQLKPAEQGAQIEGHAETLVLRWHACKTRNILKSLSFKIHMHAHAVTKMQLKSFYSLLYWSNSWIPLVLSQQ
jgi:hypothetical protein